MEYLFYRPIKDLGNECIEDSNDKHDRQHDLEPRGKGKTQDNTEDVRENRTTHKGGKKADDKGDQTKFSQMEGDKSLTRRQAVKDPAISLAMLPKGNADLEEGTMVSPATNPVPRARKRPG